MSPELDALKTAGEARFARPATIRTAGIVGLGAALPERRVSSAEIAQRLGLTAEWIERRTGIQARRHAEPGQRTSDLAGDAARAALQDAGLDASELDLLLVATITPDEITPNAAPLVAHELGATKAATMDVNAACTGSLVALAHAASWIESGRARHALVIGAEIMSRLIDFDDRRTAPLFADGAGAIVVSADAAGEIGPVVLGSDGGAASMIRATYERHVLEMEGHETFLAAVAHLCECTEQVLDRAGLQRDDIDLFVYHQANSRILAAVAERLQLPSERVFDCIAELGNTSAASLPLALAAAADDGLLQPGARVLLGAIGAGIAWGATVLRWGGS